MVCVVLTAYSKVQEERNKFLNKKKTYLDDSFCKRTYKIKKLTIRKACMFHRKKQESGHMILC